MRRTALLLFILALLATGCRGQTARRAAPPTTEAPLPSCLTASERPKLVSFPSPDGQTTGYLAGGGNVGVVLAHQSDGDLCQWKPFADVLAKKGYRALAFDFGSYLVDEVVAAVQQLRRQGVQQVFLIGASMGGAAVLEAATKADPPVTGVISLSAPQSYGDADAGQAAPKLAVPVLYVAARDDSSFADDARVLYGVTQVRDRRLVIVDGNSHGVALVNVFAGDVTDLVEKFLRDHTGR